MEKKGRQIFLKVVRASKLTRQRTLQINNTHLDWSRCWQHWKKRQKNFLIHGQFTETNKAICHQKLLQKLSAVGASPAVVQWFRSYLSDRTQSVRIDSVLSDPLPITHGVPQGAILLPLLFCIYLNDLNSASSSHTSMTLKFCYLFP